ncbi:MULTISPECIES: ATP-dependent RNA helicase DbpA [unclassified Halomonas]|uniref:ATP-dependent RNA helicase DbpA n=1 Tax=unclassified Halomonas TaxID=2609666 RepID=UPI0021E40CA7|nr:MULTISPECIES: ATP-dependent RNA helicase DbpA [unclassified Halomonas]UYF98969.1 ATP-dependent RNA helicase DbpA [Halomonas sp. GD1P12]WNL39911.1 ATP-dependent RNA helicase DbpA [Halomonas sp. PAMB 3232]
MADTSFASLALPSALTDNLASLGYHEMTPIQAQSLPPMLEGRDVLGQAKTGSGKTAAFGLALLAKLMRERSHVQALVLCPTRELADQVAESIRKLARALPNVKVLTLCGGAPLGPQIGSLEHGAHIVVGTPGRIDEHLRKGSLSLDALETLVLDEADRMLDMGFRPAIDAIIRQTPKARQTLLFSATFPDDNEGGELFEMTRGVLTDYVSVAIEDGHDAATIEQHFFAVQSEQARLAGLEDLLLHYRPTSSVVFCNTKRETDEVAEALSAHGFSAVALHGDLEQKERDRLLVTFANQSVSILVATDVAARGLDIAKLDAVFNYQLAREQGAHVHRVGRTGRAGESGVAATLIAPEERYRLERLSDYLNEPLTVEPLPRPARRTPFTAAMATLQLNGGKKDKLRPGDILGALTGEGGIRGDQVGSIKVQARSAFVAVERGVVDQALGKLSRDKLKGRAFRVRRI